ncbi:hypothetical protein CRM22_010491 [Opisthorchis felineus]|uniref:Uncharacterized protein n=1 Tax=Opisthorchis felineus TaxID=147828 RepID=A0A4S2KYG9_OPIFE|nr:hypothetical protein CRM22_010491 [Opisthorchis felineus]
MSSEDKVESAVEDLGVSAEKVEEQVATLAEVQEPKKLEATAPVLSDIKSEVTEAGKKVAEKLEHMKEVTEQPVETEGKETKHYASSVKEKVSGFFGIKPKETEFEKPATEEGEQKKEATEDTETKEPKHPMTSVKDKVSEFLGIKAHASEGTKPEADKAETIKREEAEGKEKGKAVKELTETTLADEPETEEGAVDEKKGGVMKWLKKNVTMHLPKSQANKKEKCTSDTAEDVEVTQSAGVEHESVQGKLEKPLTETISSGVKEEAETRSHSEMKSSPVESVPLSSEKPVQLPNVVQAVE